MKSIEIIPDQKSSFKNPERVTLDAEDSVLWINNVFGINKEGALPARFLSGFLSTFSLAEMIQERTQGRAVPQVRIFIPSNISMFINGIGFESAQRQIERGTSLIETLVRNHFPSVNIFFDRDQPVSETGLQILKDVADLFMVHTDNDSLIQGIRESGMRRGGEVGASRALLYAAHHPFGWNDLHHVAIFEEDPPFTVVNTLPPSEKRFAQVRRSIREHIVNSGHRSLICGGKRFDLVMMMCEQPHYLLIADKSGKPLEPTLDDLFSATCREILESIEARRKEEQTPWLRDNLRRARIDFERLLTKLGGVEAQALGDISFQELIESSR